MTATAIDATQLRVAQRGYVKVAPKGSTVPTDTTTAWDAAWSDLGYTDEKGVVFSKKDTKTAIKAWQSLTPVRYILTERDVHVAFVLEQWNKVTFALWSGQGASAVGPNGVVVGEYKLSLSPTPTVDERMLGFEWSDPENVVTHRVITQRGTVTDTADITIARAMVGLGVTFQTIAIDNATDLVTFLMKDPAMAP
jgi:hypothetical protein